MGACRNNFNPYVKRRAPQMLSPQQREFRALEQRAKQGNRAAAMPVFFGPQQLTAGGQIKQ
jgi:hypothetical protein